MSTPTAKSLKRRVLKHKNRRGTVMALYMVMLTTVITGAVASVAVLSHSQTDSTGVGFDRDQAFYAAEAGIQQTVWNTNYNSNVPSWLGTLPITFTMPNHSTYKIQATTDVSSWPNSPLTFQCIGTSADGTVTSQANVTITQNTTTSPGYAPGFAMSGADTFAGTLNIAGTFESTGSITSSGTINLTNVAGQPASSLESTGSYTAAGIINVPGNVIFNGGISASGKLTVGGYLQSGGAVTISGTNSNTINGNLVATNAVSLSSTGMTNIGGNLQAGSSTGTTLSGTTVVGGNVSATGSITSSGSATIGGNVQSGSTISHSGTWNVAGTTTDKTTTPSPASPGLTFTTPTVDTTTLSNTAKNVGAQYSSITNNTLDFTKSDVIEITKSASVSGSLTIIPPADGSTPTLLVDGSLSIAANLGSSASPVKVNLVTSSSSSGYITLSGTQYINGTICCARQLIMSGTSNINGTVVVQNGITGSGTMNITYSTPPSFVNWSGTGAGIGGTTNSTVAASNFSGPIY